MIETRTQRYRCTRSGKQNCAGRKRSHDTTIVLGTSGMCCMFHFTLLS